MYTRVCCKPFRCVCAHILDHNGFLQNDLTILPKTASSVSGQSCDILIVIYWGCSNTRGKNQHDWYITLQNTTSISSLTFVRCGGNFISAILNFIIQNSSFGTRCGIPSQANTTESHYLWINIGSGDGLVLSGNKPFSELMLTQIYVMIWCH